MSFNDTTFQTNLLYLDKLNRSKLYGNVVRDTVNHSPFLANEQLIIQYTLSFISEEIFADKIPRCTLDECKGLVKPGKQFKFNEVIEPN